MFEILPRFYHHKYQYIFHVFFLVDAISHNSLWNQVFEVVLVTSFSVGDSNMCVRGTVIVFHWVFPQLEVVVRCKVDQFLILSSNNVYFQQRLLVFLCTRVIHTVFVIIHSTTRWTCDKANKTFFVEAKERIHFVNSSRKVYSNIRELMM